MPAKKDDEAMELIMKPIGIIHTPLIQTNQTPIQSSRSNIIGTIELFPQYTEGLEGIEGFSHLYLLYIFHQVQQEKTLKVQPFLDDRLHGIFSTRHPNRPNPIGLSVVRLLKCEDNGLEFLGADMINGTPLLDIKPYIPDFDIHLVSKIGWYADRSHP